MIERLRVRYEIPVRRLGIPGAGHQPADIGMTLSKRSAAAPAMQE